MLHRRMQWFAGVAFIILLAGCTRPERQPALYQVSTLPALMQGAYDGVVSFGELRRHGDIGLGTINALDGEMILLDGHAWQVRADGRIRQVPDGRTTPFAVATFFDEDRMFDIAGPLDMPGLAGALDRELPSNNFFYVVRLDGRFAYIKTRSVRPQKPPYPTLVEASKSQTVFERENVQGTLVAVRCPAFAAGINMPGWHMHFLSKDHKIGGHVLALQLKGGRARLACLRQFDLVLPSKGRFVTADLGGTPLQTSRRSSSRRWLFLTFPQE